MRTGGAGPCVALSETRNPSHRILSCLLAAVVGDVLLVVTRALLDLGDLFLVLEAVVGDFALEVGDFDDDGLLGGLDVQFAALAGGEVVVE